MKHKRKGVRILASVGATYTDSDSGRTYECQSVITVSPTLITGKAGTYTTYLDVTMEGIKETPGNAVVLVDEDGNEVVAVLVDEEVDFTATSDDIREGMVAATDEGVTVGEKFIPSYHTAYGTKLIVAGRTLSITGLTAHDNWDYTKFQGIVCLYNKNMAGSVASEMVVIDDNVYKVQSTDSVSTLSKNHDTKSIELGITNDFGKPCVVRYITYKEVD